MVTDAPNDSRTEFPPHIEQTVQAIARLHQAHHERATSMERLVDRLTGLVARPAFIGVTALVVVVWITASLALRRYEGWSLDNPPFPWLQGAAELVAIVITTLILTSQRRKDELSELREQLTLELATMTEQKVAKLIALMEEQRRDSPQLADRVDTEAEQMSAPADPETVVEAIREKVGETNESPAQTVKPKGRTPK
ncbi:MAG TPA: DUF1003 domain-containing protein [Caulobacteraceae bacterium]